MPVATPELRANMPSSPPFSTSCAWRWKHCPRPTTSLSHTLPLSLPPSFLILSCHLLNQGGKQLPCLSSVEIHGLNILTQGLQLLLTARQVQAQSSGLGHSSRPSSSRRAPAGVEASTLAMAIRRQRSFFGSRQQRSSGG